VIYHTPLQSPAHKSHDYPCHVAITLRVESGQSELLVRHISLLRDCGVLSKRRWDFVIQAAAVLPAEMHLLCAFGGGHHDASGAIRLITSTFDRHVSDHCASVWSDTCEVIEVSSRVAHLRRRFVEAAPVRAGLVSNVCDWPYSSAHVDTAQSDDMGVAVA
jgi:putative transposase